MCEKPYEEEQNLPTYEQSEIWKSDPSRSEETETSRGPRPTRADITGAPMREYIVLDSYDDPVELKWNELSVQLEIGSTTFHGKEALNLIAFISSL
jgi:hypothetical protein